MSDLSQVQRVRLKQWYRKNVTAKPAAAPKAEEEVRIFRAHRSLAAHMSAPQAKPAAPQVTYTPEEMAAIEAVKAQMRKPQDMLTPISEWVPSHATRRKRKHIRTVVFTRVHTSLYISRYLH